MKDNPKLPGPAVIRAGLRYDGVRNPMQEVPSLPPAHPALVNLKIHAPQAATRNGTIGECLRLAEDHEMVYLPGVSEFCVQAKELRELVATMFKKTPEQFCKMSSDAQDRAANKIRRVLLRALRTQHPRPSPENLERDRRMAGERGRVYAALRDGWARGELRLERPSGSSLHHLLEYDRQHTEGNFAQDYSDDMQPIVVEHEWARVVPPEGEWRLPFATCCWEFKISGVRVLAVTDVIRDESRTSPSRAAHGDAAMIVIYGHDGHWVCDDLLYVIEASGRLVVSRDQNPIPDAERRSLRRVIDFVHANIRACCIMMDASICRREHVAAPAALVKRRAAEGRAPPRDHSVVRLVREHARQRAARSAGAGTGAAKAAQRGHWRRGTFVHFDDQDSGREQYVNDGGFFVSKTWRPWHFAGDPNNLMPNREYRI